MTAIIATKPAIVAIKGSALCWNSVGNVTDRTIVVIRISAPAKVFVSIADMDVARSSCLPVLLWQT
jgi:hypothetical protein